MVLAIIYLIECPLNVRYYEFTVGMTIVSLTVSYLSNLLSDYRLNLPKGNNSMPASLFAKIKVLNSQRKQRDFFSSKALKAKEEIGLWWEVERESLM